MLFRVRKRKVAGRKKKHTHTKEGKANRSIGKLVKPKAASTPPSRAEGSRPEPSRAKLLPPGSVTALSAESPRGTTQLIQIPSAFLHNNEPLSGWRVDRGKAFSTAEWRRVCVWERERENDGGRRGGLQVENSPPPLHCCQQGGTRSDASRQEVAAGRGRTYIGIRSSPRLCESETGRESCDVRLCVFMWAAKCAFVSACLFSPHSFQGQEL